jgi:hypothetical protein
VHHRFAARIAYLPGGFGRIVFRLPSGHHDRKSFACQM